MRKKLAVLLFWLCAVSLAQAAATPDSDFTDNGNGTITHKTTGLTWKRCAEGQTWTGATCSGAANTYSWDQAIALGTNGWGLPTIAQLKTILDSSRAEPSINTTIFPNTPAAYFWSATVDSTDAGYALPLYFDQVYSAICGKGYQFHVRLVVGGQSTAAKISTPTAGQATPTSTKDADFIVNSDGTATHKVTGLTWKRCAEGQTWTGATCGGAASTYDWYQALGLGSGGWGLPTIEELRTLLDLSRTEPSINPTIFPNTPAAYFWSSTTEAGNGDYAYPLYFGNVYSVVSGKSYAFPVRLVRRAQAATRDPATVFPASDSDHIFDYLEKRYPQYLAPTKSSTEAASGYEYRYYPTTQAYVGTSNGKLYYLGPASGNALLEMGTVSDWLVTASKAGF